MKKYTLRAIPALLLVALSGSATAAGFQLLEQNASGIGVAYAGSAAVADNASTIFFNPAGMTQFEGGQVSVGATAVGPSYEYRSNAGVSSGGDAGSWGLVPNAYLSYQLTKDLVAGFGVSVPFGLATEYNAGWAGATRAIKSEIRTINYNPSLAYRVNDKVSLGFGINYQSIDGELTRFSGAPAVGNVRLKGDDNSWGWNVGALFTLSPAMRVGVSYRSSVSHMLEGNVTTNLSSVPVRARLKLPDTYTLSVWQQVSDRWEAMGDISYTGWDSLQKFDVYRRDTGALLPGSEIFGYENAWRIAWGAAYKATDAAKLKFGIAYDWTPVTDTHRSPRVPDNNRLWLSLGGQWNAGRAGKIDLGYAYLFVKDPSINQGTLQGKYDASAHILGVQYSVGF